MFFLKSMSERDPLLFIVYQREPYLLKRYHGYIV